jgi:hypothetical protein
MFSLSDQLSYRGKVLKNGKIEPHTILPIGYEKKARPYLLAPRTFHRHGRAASVLAVPAPRPIRTPPLLSSLLLIFSIAGRTRPGLAARRQRRKRLWLARTKVLAGGAGAPRCASEGRQWRRCPGQRAQRRRRRRTWLVARRRQCGAPTAWRRDPILLDTLRSFGRAPTIVKTVLDVAS